MMRQWHWSLWALTRWISVKAAPDLVVEGEGGPASKQMAAEKMA